MNNNNGVHLFLRLFSLTLLLIYFGSPHDSITLPAWYNFFVHKLCIAIPMVFILVGYDIEQQFCSLVNNRTNYTSIAQQVGKQWLSFFETLVFGYLCIAIIGYYFVDSVIGWQPFFPQGKQTLFNSIIYPQYHPILFLKYIPLLAISLLAVTFIQQSLLYLVTIKRKAKKLNLTITRPQWYKYVLWGVFLLVFAYELLLSPRMANKLFFPLGLNNSNGTLCYIVAGMLLYHYHPYFTLKRVKVTLLLLFHAVLFTRLFASPPNALLQLLNLLYNLLLATLYFLLAIRGSRLMHKPLPNFVSKHAPIVFVIGWFLMSSLWPIYIKVGNNNILFSIALLLVCAIGFLVPCFILWHSYKNLRNA